MWFALIQVVAISTTFFFLLSRKETALVFKFHEVTLKFQVVVNPQWYFVKLSQPSGVD